MQEKESTMVVWCELKISSLRITVRHHLANLMLPTSYPLDGIFNPHLPTIKDSYNGTWTSWSHNKLKRGSLRNRENIQRLKTAKSVWLKIQETATSLWSANQSATRRLLNNLCLYNNGPAKLESQFSDWGAEDWICDSLDSPFSK